MAFSELTVELSRLGEQGLWRKRRVVQGPQATKISVGSRELLCFAANDYLGLANDSRIADALREAVGRYGVGAGASHLICGHGLAHEAIETALAEFVGQERALLFANGYMANIGVVTALVDRGDAVFGDRLNHASLNDAALLSRAKFQRYPHTDMQTLGRLLSQSRAKRKLVVSDAVFSMDGDLAPVKALVELCERYDAWLLLDDAHGFGILGEHGQGVLSHLSVSSPRVIYMATLGKAAGVYGAFVAGAAELIETLIQRARTYVYTTATPQCLAHAALTSLRLIREESWRRNRLSDLALSLVSKLHLSRWRLRFGAAAIHPVVIGSNDETLRVSQTLMDEDIWVPAIRPPTVPRGTARLRISLSAAHTMEDIERLASALNKLE